MSKLSLSVQREAERLLAIAESPAAVKDIETLAAAAKRYAKSLEERNFAAEMQLRAGRRGGQMLIEMAETGQRRTTGDGQSRKVSQTVTPSLSELGIEPMRSSRWQWLARLSEARFEGYIEQTKAEAEPVTAAGLAVHFSSESAEWYTPLEVIQRVVAALGAIDLDPCSDSKTEPNVPAAKHFTAEDDGLSQHWLGRVYMNPPYGNVIGEWVDKLAREYEQGSVTAAIALVPARCDTVWFRRLPSRYICLVDGRLEFSRAGVGAPFPSALFYLGDRPGGFLTAFSDFGLLYRRLTAVEAEAVA